MPDSEWGHDGFEALQREEEPASSYGGDYDDDESYGESRGRGRGSGGGRAGRGGGRSLASVVMRSVVLQPEETERPTKTLVVRNQGREAAAAAAAPARTRSDVRDRLGGKGPVVALSTGTTIRVANLAPSVTAEDMKVRMFYYARSQISQSLEVWA